MTDKDKRKGWLKELKAGDEVIVFTAGFNRKELIGTVKKITPTGRITLSEPNATFDPYGWEICDDKWSKWHISQASPEKIQEINIKQKKKNLINKIDSFVKKLYSNGSLEDLEMIANIVSKYGQP